MKARWLLFALAPLVAIATPVAASADEVVAAPRHGGRLVTFGDNQIRVEAVHDPAFGTFTVYGVPSTPAASPGASSAGSMCGRSAGRPAMNAPVLVVTDGTATRTLSGVAVAGESGTWRFSDPALKAAAVDARIRIAGRDGPLEAAWIAAAKSAEGSPAAWASNRGPLALSTEHGRFEVSHDADAGSITVIARNPSNATLELSAAPVLALRLPDGTSRPLTLEKVEGRPGVWRGTAEELKVGPPLGTLRVDIDGRAEEAELVAAPAEPPTTPASAEAPNALKTTAKAPVASSVLVFADGALRLKVSMSTAGDAIVLAPLTEKDARTLGDGAPVIVVSGSEGDQTLRAQALEDRSQGWTVKDPSVLAGRADARVRVTIDGRTHEAPLVLSKDGETGSHGGMIATFGEGAATLEVVRDAANGTLVLYAPAGKTTALSIEGTPEVVVETPSGLKTLTVEAMPDVPGAWRVVGDELKGKDLTGTLKIRVGEKSFEAPLPAARSDLAKPIERKQPEEIGSAPAPTDQR